MFFNNSQRKGIVILTILILALLLLPRAFRNLSREDNHTSSHAKDNYTYLLHQEGNDSKSAHKRGSYKNESKKSSNYTDYFQRTKSSNYKSKGNSSYTGKANDGENDKIKSNKEVNYTKDFYKDNYHKKKLYKINIRKYNTYKIELNSADTNSLTKIVGIGKYYAKKIINYRIRLGGYINLDQLKEINMQYLDVETIVPHLYLNKDLIIKRDLNTLSFKELLKHPYLDYNDVQLIFQAKTKYNKISVKLLQQKGILILSKIQKIQPYFK